MPNEAKSILIVEDERIVATDLHRTLHKQGYRMLGTAATADHALEITARDCPDLVLMDVRIKGQLDGIDTARLLRRRYGVPVIFLTAHGDLETVERAKQAEPYGYLLKPINNDEVRSSVEIALHKHALDQQLQQRERWFATTLHSIGDAVIAVDLAGCITFMNAEAEVLTGFASADAIGKDARTILQLSVAKNDSLDPPFEKVLSQRQKVTIEEASIRNHATNALRLITDSAAPVILNGELLGAVMVFRDVTAQKQLQHQVELADRLASLGTMAAGVAHEIRNPLTAVLGQSALAVADIKEHRADLAREFSSLPPQIKSCFERSERALNEIHANAERISRIVGQLREFARPMQATTHECNVVDALAWAIRVTAHEFQSRAQVKSSLENVPPVAADKAGLEQVFVNLLINAAQAIEPGHSDRNSVAITTRLDARGWVVVDVQDSGHGIPNETLKHVFDPFFTTKSVGEGLGLGLSICHRIVTSFGGELRIDSTEGRGTLCTVLLPPACQTEMSKSSECAADTPSDLRSRILVIDDEEPVRSLIEAVLSNHEVISVPSARDALDRLRQGDRFDLIISDVLMPTMTGFEFYQTLSQEFPELAQRVLFLTGGAISAQMDTFLQSLPHKPIDKPFDIDKLRMTVHSFLSNRSPAAAAHPSEVHSSHLN